MSIHDGVNALLDNTVQSGLYRKRVIQDNEYLHFSSNDYLSLQKDPAIRKAYATGLEKFGGGSGGSAVICGYHSAHQSLERAFKEQLSVDDCLLFSSGYSANLAVLNLLASLKIHALIDRGVHASIYDGLCLSRVAYTRYRHNNMHDLASRLPDKNTAIITESIFSMSGQQAPLQEIAAHCNQNRVLIVDEAHAFGVIGQKGMGAVALSGLIETVVPLRIIPLGKACAGQGAIVAGHGQWIDALLQCARSFIYSTAMSPGLAYGMEKTLEVVVASDDRRQKLQYLIDIFRKNTLDSSLHWTSSETPIQQLRVGCPHKALRLGEYLKRKGIVCMPIRYPTVHPKDSGLRIVLNFDHEASDIHRLFTAVHECQDFLSLLPSGEKENSLSALPELP